MLSNLTEYHKAILGYLAEDSYGKRGEDQIYDEFVTKTLRRQHIKVILKDLEKTGNIKPIELNEEKIQFIAEMTGTSTSNKGYKITHLGKHHLGKSGTNGGISVGNNVNFALNSPGAQQSIDITDFNEDVQVKISEMQEAAATNNKPKFLKALGYILDKGVDVAVALALLQAGVPK